MFRKTWLLVGLFLVIILGIGYFLSYQYNSPGILTIAIIFSVVMNIAAFWYSDKIALSIAHAKPADPKEYLELHRIVENLAITAGLPKPKVYIIDDPAPNAFATGRNKNHAVVAVTSGILSMLDRTELEGVIAHELSHIGNRDILLQSVIVVLVGFVSILANIFTRSMFFGGGDRDERRGGNILAIIGIVFIILSPLFAQLIQLAISRKREFLADASGALLTRYPQGLASALQKISSYKEPMRYASDATAHLFISNPFGGKVFGSIHKLFMTHPPTEERIRALLGSNANSENKDFKKA
jgi:heat shock protein HtpX